MINSLVTIIPKTDRAKKYVLEYGEVAKVFDTIGESILIGNVDCTDYMSDLGNYKWSSWLTLDSAEFIVHGSSRHLLRIT